MQELYHHDERTHFQLTPGLPISFMSATGTHSTTGVQVPSDIFKIVYKLPVANVTVFIYFHQCEACKG